MISPPVSIVSLCFTYVKQMFHRGAKLLSALCLLLSRMFTYELRMSPRCTHATIPLFHWFRSCFLVVHMFYQCDIRILVFSHGKRKLFLLFSVLWTCEILVKILCVSCENHRWFLCVSCENLVYARGLLWGITARLCLQEITFGIQKSTMGGCLWSLAPQRFHNITSDNHTLSE